jgi:crossover junction endodeoxyribonuclease RuvC
MNMTVIIGIDPGSRHTGYGIIRVDGNQSFHITHGCIHLMNTPLPDRLQKIFAGLQEVVQLYQPHEAAIEQVFMHENPGAALKLGQARGAAIVALTIPVAEYSARQVKQSVVGYGAAEKEQVQHMVGRLLNLTDKLQADAADALAIALCHAHTRLSLAQTGLLKRNVKRSRSSSWRSYQPDNGDLV